MAKLTITVPNGSSCEHCPYLRSEYVETYYNSGHTVFNCGIFKSEISNYKKCSNCYLETNDKGGENT